MNNVLHHNGVKGMKWTVKAMNNVLYHNGIKGMKWGVRNGPPYPINQDF